MRLPLAALVAAAVVLGHVTDATTGQPLVGVVVRAGDASATTDARGAYALRGLAAKTYDVTLQSDDVPLVHHAVRVGPGTTKRDFTACSTTLDYGCNRGPASGNAAG